MGEELLGARRVALRGCTKTTPPIPKGRRLSPRERRHVRRSLGVGGRGLSPVPVDPSVRDKRGHLPCCPHPSSLRTTPRHGGGAFGGSACDFTSLYRNSSSSYQGEVAFATRKTEGFQSCRDGPSRSLGVGGRGSHSSKATYNFFASSRNSSVVQLLPSLR